MCREKWATACALQYSACVRRGSCSDPRNVLRPHTFDGAPAWRSVQRWKPSDSLCPAALAQPRPTAAIQLQQTLTASLFAPAVLSGAQRAAQQRVGPLRFFEDASWPKAPSCISDPGAKQNDLSVRTIRVVRSSELNPNRTGWLYLRSRGVVLQNGLADLFGGGQGDVFWAAAPLSLCILRWLIL